MHFMCGIVPDVKFNNYCSKTFDQKLLIYTVINSMFYVFLIIIYVRSTYSFWNIHNSTSADCMRHVTTDIIAATKNFPVITANFIGWSKSHRVYSDLYIFNIIVKYWRLCNKIKRVFLALKECAIYCRKHKNLNIYCVMLDNIPSCMGYMQFVCKWRLARRNQKL